MNEMNDFEHERQVAMSTMALKAFPRSVGMLSGAISLLITRNPFTALEIFLGAWVITAIVKWLLPANVVRTNLWLIISLPVNLISSWPVRWFLYITLVIVSLITGAPLSLTLIIMGGILFFDLLTMKTGIPIF